MERSGIAHRGRPDCKKHTEKTLFTATKTAFLIAGTLIKSYL